MKRLTMASCIVVLCPVALHAQGPAQWTLRPVVVVGGAQANDDRYTFEQVTPEAIAGRANGNLLVLDIQGKRVLEYDDRGRHVRTLGRGGSGPGEFRFPTAVTVGAGDSVWVFDVERVSVFPDAGQPVRTQSVPTRTFGLARVGAHGVLRALAAVPGAAGTGSLVPGRMEIARFNGAGVIADTVWRGPFPSRALIEVSIGNDIYRTHATEQYAVTTHWDQLSDGTLVIADTSAYVLRLVTPDGRVQRTFGTREGARPTTAADRQRALERLRGARDRRSQDRFPTPPALFSRQLEQTPFSPVIPRIAGVRVDPDDRIWVGVSGDRRDLERIDIYDRSGTLVARVADPPAMPAALYGTGLAAVLERDGFDAQQVRILRVMR
jgi:hypothetical protein